MGAIHGGGIGVILHHPTANSNDIHVLHLESFIFPSAGLTDRGGKIHGR